MTPLTAAQVAKARKSWNVVIETESLNSQSIAAALWSSLWAERLLAAAEVLTALQDAVRVPRTFPVQDPDT